MLLGISPELMWELGESLDYILTEPGMFGAPCCIPATGSLSGHHTRSTPPVLRGSTPQAPQWKLMGTDISQSLQYKYVGKRLTRVNLVEKSNITCPHTHGNTKDVQRLCPSCAVLAAAWIRRIPGAGGSIAIKPVLTD